MDHAIAPTPEPGLVHCWSVHLSRCLQQLFSQSDDALTEGEAHFKQCREALQAHGFALWRSDARDEGRRFFVARGAWLKATKTLDSALVLADKRRALLDSLERAAKRGDRA